MPLGDPSLLHGRPHRTFVTDLFNRWQLGAADRDDSLLLFVSLDDRKAEIILGDGVDCLDQTAAIQRIMDQVGRLRIPRCGGHT